MITDLIHWLTGAVLLLTLLMLVRPIFRSQIHLYIGQAILMTAVTLLVAIELNEQHLYLTALLTIAVKVIAIPCGLIWLLKRLGSSFKAPVALNPAPVAIISALLIGFSYFVTQQISSVLKPDSVWILTIALSLFFLGMLMIIVQHSALSQMIGFLILENGVLLLAIAAEVGLPTIVELGLLLDVLVGVAVLAALAARMNALLRSTDTGKLSELKDE